MEEQHGIKHFPVAFFSVVLGLAGFTIAFQKAEAILGIPFSISPFLLIITLIVFGIIWTIYIVKIIKFRNDVRNEFSHPVKLSFFPTFSISLLLISIAFLSINLTVSKYFWVSGTIIQLIFTINIISIWIHHTKFEITHMNPAWFIPAVGNIIIPVAGVSHFSSEISWFFYSIGLMFWIVLMTIFFYRIIFYKPLPDRLLPTLFILIAPPAVAFISFVKLTGTVNEFSKILYYFALFLVLLLFSQIKMFFKIIFYLSWWAYSFPMSAVTIASMAMFHETDIQFFKLLSSVLLILLCITIAVLVVKTGKAIFKKEICVEED
jgi:tellurite resistance protein